MTSPKTEIVWEAGNWTRAQRRVARPWVTPAIGLAEEGIDHLGIQPTTPKRAKMIRVGNQYPTVGGSLDEFSLELCIRHKVVKRKKLGRFFPSLTVTAAHEMVHCVRSEGEVDEDSLLENVAAEGIAYQAEFALAQELLKEDELMHEYGISMVGLPTRIEKHLLGALHEDATEIATLRAEKKSKNEELINEIQDVWLDLHSPTDLALGDKLGIMAVGRLLEDGASFPDILAMPPTEILQI